MLLFAAHLLQIQGNGAHANYCLCVRVSVRDDIAMPGSKVAGAGARLRYRNQRAGESSVFISDLRVLQVMVKSRKTINYE